MKSAIIIPARYNSSRFKGKPLVLINGKSMIRRVYEQCVKSNANTVVVATDDQRIFDHVKEFGNVRMTGEHETGTARVAEVAQILDNDIEIIINIQGDEPMINPGSINKLISIFKDNSINIATFKYLIDNQKEKECPNTVKVVCDNNDDALYFSRFSIPYHRENSGSKIFKHIGTYAFRQNTLNKICKLPTSMLEKTEKLEQLTWLSHGYKIKVLETKHDAISVDTPQDLADVEKILKRIE